MEDDTITVASGATVRFELTMIPDMREGLRRLARRQGLSEASVIKYLLAQELTVTYGTDWANGKTRSDPA